MLINTTQNPVKEAVIKAYSYARAGNPEVTKAVGDYLKLGKDIPMATTMYKADEIYKARRYFNELLKSDTIKGADDYNAKWSSMLNTVSEQESVDANFDAEFDFYESLQKLYPKTIKKRMKLIASQIKKMLVKIDAE